MLHIKVELWPYGDPSKSREIAAFNITNKTPIKLRNGDFTLDHRPDGLTPYTIETTAWDDPTRTKNSAFFLNARCLGLIACLRDAFTALHEME